MLYPDTDPKHFSLKHGVPLCSRKCHKCGIETELNIPVISKDYVGFESKDHGCGKEFIVSLVKIRNLPKLD